MITPEMSLAPEMESFPGMAPRMPEVEPAAAREEKTPEEANDNLDE